MANKKYNNGNYKRNSSNNRNYNKSSNKSYKDKEKFNIEKAVKEESISKDTTVSTLIDEDLRNYKDESKVNKKPKHIIVHLFLVLLLFISLVFLGLSFYDKEIPIITLISNLLLTLFTILFVVISISYNKKNKSVIFICGLLLLSYFILNINNSVFIGIPNAYVEDFSGKSLTYVMKWALANDVIVNQDYEYSDMIEEYKIISQDISSGTNLKKLKEITVSVSEGPNPAKEVVVPSMITWDSERVIDYVKENHLSNVIVEFVESDKAKDTVIEQNTSGTLKRDDELKLTFSYGEELGYDEVSLIDFTGKSKFEVEFYMKQHQLEYEFEEDFSNKEKRGFAIKQNIESGKKVKVKDEKVIVTISKGPKIRIPDLKEFSMTEVTEWAIKNKLKLEFSDKYDDTVKENDVISANFEKGKIIEQGTVIKIVISRGKLKMGKFKSFNEFREWAEKYEIKYEEKHEFNNDIEAGEVISYSYKNGDTIKNDDVIIVKISDGKKCEVPNLKGLSKSDAISKLEKANLKYNFVYKASNDVSKDKVISQSISAGSEVSSGTTITVTLSNGKKESSSNNSSSNKGNSSSSGNNSSNSSNSGSSGSNNNSNTNKPVTCNDCTITGLKNEYNKYIGDFNKTANALRSYITGQCPGIKVNIIPDYTTGKTPGSPVSGFTGGDTNSCATISITIADTK